MSKYILDLESDGLIPQMTKIHCIVLKDIDTEEVISCADQPGYRSLETALDYISEADLLVFHNGIKFDIPALKKIYSGLALKPTCQFYDTLITSRLFWPELEPIDRARWSHIEPKYMGRHSLAAWGERLGVAKIKFTENAKKDPAVVNVWAEWSANMQTYCEGDVEVSGALYRYMLSQNADPRSLELEHEFAIVMSRQEQFGFPFNEKAAFALVNTLKAERSEIDEQLQDVFPPVVESRISPKTGRQLKDKVTVFNPASRQQTAERLKALYPEITFASTDKGNPQVDDDVLEALGTRYPEAKILARYQLLNKRIGQIADGKEAWLRHCQVYGDGRIHGEVVTNACVSGRCSHKRPNMAQVPSVGHAYGAECRSLFYAPEGWQLVGADASGLELRALGAWLAYFDGGEYARLVSTDGFDIHTHNARLFGIYSGDSPIEKATRDLSKRLIYAVLYGAGAAKVGSVINSSTFVSESVLYELGKKTINTFYKNLSAIKQLKDLIDKRIGERGYLTGIDGRRLQIRSKHSALNQLLQSTGAVTVKKATTILYNDLTSRGLKFGKDWAFVAHVHDELQTLVRPEYVELYKELAIDSFRKSGEYFNLKCPMTGESRVGQNWMETH
jgi:DNA polymerase I-like protein with 3'-5' exonuclease and polymerase domains